MATILIIDDDQKLNDLLKGFLSDFGFTVLAATHPEKGLKKLKQKAPDLVILDVIYSYIDGLYVLEKLLSILKDSCMPVLVASTINDPLFMIDAIERGASDYTPFPVDMEKLALKVKKLIG